MDSKEDTFITQDVGCASALISVGYKLLGLDKENPKQVKFILFRSEGIDDSINRYWNNALLVSARTFYENLIMLKTKIFKEV